MLEQNYPGSVESKMLPNLSSAYNLARWLMLNDQDAENVAQEAYLRAFKLFAGFRGGNGRLWLLKVVHNTCHAWLQVNRPFENSAEFDEKLFPLDFPAINPDEIFLQNDSHILRRALEKLPSVLREVLILRELEGMSYKEISEVTGTSQGTVMARLSRARTGLCLTPSELADACCPANIGRRGQSGE